MQLHTTNSPFGFTMPNLSARFFALSLLCLVQNQVLFATSPVTSHLGATVDTDSSTLSTPARKFTAKDANANSSACTEMFLWTDDTAAPRFVDCPQGHQELGCNVTKMPDAELLTATDNCCAPVITSAVTNVTQQGSFYKGLRVYTATDVSGNTAICVVELSWKQDNQAPKFLSLPENQDLGVNPTAIPAAATLYAADESSLPSITNWLSAEEVNGNAHSLIRTYAATDDCGNTATCTQKFTWTVDGGSVVTPVTHKQ